MSDAKHNERDIHWHAPEFEYRAKGELWYLAVILAVAALIIFALWQRNFLFAVFTGVAGILVISWGKRFPATLKFSIEDHGFRIDSIKFHPWSEFEYFAVREEQGKLSEIVFKKRRRGAVSLVHVFAYTDDLAKIRGRLSEHLPETNHEESLVDSLERIVGF